MVSILEDKPYSRAGEDDDNEALPLKIHLSCSQCGGKFSGYMNKKKKKAYYICNSRGCSVYVAGPTVNTGFSEFIQRLVPLDMSAPELKTKLYDLIEEVNKQIRAEEEKIDLSLLEVKKKSVR